MKSISIILILSLVFYSLGCYRSVILKKDSEIVDALENRKEIYLITDKNETYDFTYSEAYQFKNDTIYSHIDVQSNRFNPVKIAYNDIDYIKVEELDEAHIIISTILIAGAIRGFIIIWGNPIEYF